MKLVSFALKSAFVTGALTAGAFITGTALGLFLNKKKINQHQQNNLTLILLLQFK